MHITFDPLKRARTLTERGFDFVDASSIFLGPTFTMADDRVVYPEPRFITIGLLVERMIVIVWTPTGDGRRIISMRKANDREQKRYANALGGPG